MYTDSTARAAIAQMTTARGAIITVRDDGTADILMPNNTVILLGTRESWRLHDQQVVDKTGKAPYRIWGESNGRRMSVGMDGDRLTWLRDNWPITLSLTERWQAIMPDGVEAYEAWRGDWAAYNVALDRSYEDEGGCCRRPRPPSSVRPELSVEARAWLAIDDMSGSGNYMRGGIAQRAIARVVNAGVSLCDAAAEAEREWTAYCDSHAMAD